MNNDVTMGANVFSGGNVDRPREPLSMNNAVTMRPDRGASLGRIDQYELIRELGGGGFGCVYLARDTVAGIEVAVKGLPPLVRLNKEELENVRKNFALVSRLHHPNIAAALHLQKVEKAFYDDKSDAEKLRVFGGDTLVVMQYAPGVTLSQWRKQFPDGKVPLDKALEITRQIASALDYAHEEKILHRDIKPANVMIETGGDGKITARVLDFGLAAEIRSSMSRVSQSVTDTSGTRPYMAPEQWLGREQGKETDLYALAVLFNELVTGKVPFASVFDTGDPVLMMNVVGREEPEISTDLPKTIRLALTKALSKKREDRFGSCIEFVDALEGGMARSKTASRSEVARGLRASPRAYILAAVAALGLAGVGIWYWQSAKSEAEVSQKTAIVRDIEEEKRLCDDEIERQFSVRHSTDWVEKSRDSIRNCILKAYPGFMDNLKKMTLRERCRIAFFLSAYSCKKSISFILDEKLLDVNDVGDGGFLHFAAWACDKDMIDFLIARGADVNKQDKDGQSPISWASADGARGISMIKYLIERHGARIVNVDDDESLFMDLAGRSNFQEGAKYLIEERSYVPTSDELQKLGEKDKAYIESLLKKRPGLEMLKKENGPRRGDRKTLRLPGGETMTMIYVAPGSFMMGSPTTEKGRYYKETQHHVTLTKGYWLGETEVTQAQWESVMGDNPSYFKGASRPVENVSWEDCQEFIAKVNREAQRQLGGEARLPTEAEWEYACRAGSRTAYSWGNLLNGDKANCDGNYPYGTAIKGPYKAATVNVRSYSPNAWGFYDMHGNVYEWCQDWYGAYPSGAVTDPTGQASGDDRVLRGGGWSYDARDCRSASRDSGRPGFRYYNCGFRLCCSVLP